MTERITGRGAELLAILRGKPDQWMNRVELSEAIRKRALSPNDRNWLARLERAGLIEVQERPRPGAPRGSEYVYRAKS